jgi:adenosylhomocysteine nucleosidase
MFGIIGAMESEITLLKGKIEEIEEHYLGRSVFYTGKLEGQEVVLLKSGIGKVASAIGAQAMIDRFHVSGIVNTGIAGGIGKGLAVGDIVVGSFAVQHDFDMSGLGYAPGYMEGEEKDQPTRYLPDEALVQEFLQAARKVMPEEHIHRGGIATGDLFVSGSAAKKRLRETFDAMAAEMEGGAIAQTAVQNGVPFVIIRAISDLADEGAASSVEQSEQTMADRSAKILLELLKAR